MANEARITSGLSIRSPSNGFIYQASNPTFTADVLNPRGPTPGLLRVSSTTQVVDTSLLTQPGLCKVTNLDRATVLEIGLKVGSSFYPIIDVLPGEWYIFRLAKYLHYSEYPGTGTGTLDTTPNDSYLCVRMRGAAGVYSDVLFEAFDS